MTWYLVMASMYIGPFDEIACKRAAVELLQQAQCKESDYTYVCDINGRPGTYTICPHFAYPQITIKNK